MPIANETFSRRQVIAGLSAGTAALALPGCASLGARSSAAADPQVLLDQIAWNLLHHEPERATSLGVDTGARTALRGQIKDLRPEGLDALARTLRSDLRSEERRVGKGWRSRWRRSAWTGERARRT